MIEIERLNETLRFPRLRQGEADEAEVDLPVTAVNVSFGHQRQLECPAGYAEDPALIVTAPNGTEASVRVFPEGEEGQTTIYPCANASVPPGPWHQEIFVGDGGRWAVRTDGECTCTVRVVMASHEPTS